MQEDDVPDGRLVIDVSGLKLVRNLKYVISVVEEDNPMIHTLCFPAAIP